MTFSHVLAPTDMSEPSLTTLAVAVDLAQKYQAKITLLHVVVATMAKENSDWRDATKMWLGLADWQQVKDEQEALHTIAEKMVPDEVECQTKVFYGTAAEEIVAFAKNEDVDLVVMATHGRSGWRRVVHGSVTEAVLRTIPCPLLCMPKPNSSRPS